MGKNIRRYTHNCHLCSFTSDSESKVQFHLQTHVDGVIFYCDQCPYSASTDRVLRRHMKKDHGTNAAERVTAEPLKVNIPISPVPQDQRNSSLSSHSPVISDDPLEIHPQVFQFQPEPELPERNELKRFKCIYCPYSKNSRYDVRIHERIHTGEKPFSCNFCDYKSATSSALGAHRRRHHQNVATNLKSSRVSIPKRAANLHPRIKNRAAISPVTKKRVIPVIPQIVNKPPTPKPLRITLAKKVAACFQQVEVEASEDIESSEEVEAPEDIESSKDIEAPEDSESSEEVYRCGYCSFKHIEKVMVLQHMPIHNGYKPLACHLRECDYRTDSKEALRSHVRRHENKAKKAKKPSFGITIKNVNSLAKNEEIKTSVPETKTKRNFVPRFDNSDKPYKCTFCPHRSKRRHDMFKHEKIHTG